MPPRGRSSHSGERTSRDRCVGSIDAPQRHILARVCRTTGFAEGTVGESRQHPSVARVLRILQRLLFLTEVQLLANDGHAEPLCQGGDLGGDLANRVLCLIGGLAVGDAGEIEDFDRLPSRSTSAAETCPALRSTPRAPVLKSGVFHSVA